MDTKNEMALAEARYIVRTKLMAQGGDDANRCRSLERQLDAADIAKPYEADKVEALRMERDKLLERACRGATQGTDWPTLLEREARALEDYTVHPTTTTSVQPAPQMSRAEIRAHELGTRFGKSSD